MFYSSSAAKAATDLGFAYVDDINSPSEPSVSSFKTHYTLDSSGHRHSTFRAFLLIDLALERKERLHICIKSIASKLLLTEQANHGLLCTGARVQSVTNVSVWRDIRVKHEIILVAGVLRMLQILMLRTLYAIDYTSRANITQAFATLTEESTKFYSIVSINTKVKKTLPKLAGTAMLD
ncbi:hypothetical protein K439DRAFT_1613089 [Ramaria rubella]|nr:hypothetical protein K439DRAFT_1613089 [Ramaria rubella]